MKISEQIQEIIDQMQMDKKFNTPDDCQKYIELFGDLKRAYIKARKIEDPNFKEYKLNKLQDHCDCGE